MQKREEGKEREERKAKRLQDIKAKILFVGDDPSGAPVDESEVEDI